MKKPGYLLGAATAGLVKGVGHLLPTKDRIKFQAMVSDRVVPEVTLEAGGREAKFSGVTRDAARMPLTWFHHEIDTTDWIRTHFAAGETFWDVGANVGIFSIFAALEKGVKVLAFEPSAQTFGTLYRNIYLNGLGEEIDAFCIALGARKEIGNLHLAEVSSGVALNSFGEAVNTGGTFTPAFSQGTLCYPGDDFLTEYGLTPPHHIKIDVDGNEPQVLAGMTRCLASAKTVMVEMNNVPAIRAAIQAAGLRETEASGDISGKNLLYLR